MVGCAGQMQSRNIKIIKNYLQYCWMFQVSLIVATVVADAATIIAHPKFEMTQNPILGERGAGDAFLGYTPSIGVPDETT